MKKLSIEEKAKAYDEALKVLHKYDGANIMFSQSLKEEMFPELKESEDERIRKWLIHYFKEVCDNVSEKEKKGVIDWLEKHGEQNPIMIQWQGNNLKEVIDFVGKDKNFGKWFKSFEEYERYVHEHNNIFKLFNKDGSHYEVAVGAWIVKTPDGYNVASKAVLKQKPTDKIEPKFHEGDWVILTAGKLSATLQIVNVDTNKKLYWFNDDSYLPIVDEECLHLWTIQDAKDGDVLARNNGWTCIFKTLVNDETFSSYCFMDKTKWFCETGSECHTLNKEFTKAYNGEIKPATKEQRDLLFQKMKEAGYEWNAEKKELKKIENGIEIPFGAKDSELQEVTYYIPKGFHAEIDDDKVVIKKGEKPAAWSEEDEKYINGLIRGLVAKRDIHKQTTFSSDNLDITNTINWLDSLKDRLRFQLEYYNEEDLDTIADRFIPEPTWNALEESKEEGSCAAAYDYSQMIAMFKAGVQCIKSLKERYTWKPSDEQMKQLGWIAEQNKDNMIGKELMTLYQDLKKLKKNNV